MDILTLIGIKRKYIFCKIRGKRGKHPCLPLKSFLQMLKFLLRISKIRESAFFLTVKYDKMGFDNAPENFSNRLWSELRTLVKSRIERFRECSV